MKNQKLAGILSAVLLLASASIMANEASSTKPNTQNFISKRPYEQAVTNTSPSTDGQWEGATLINQETATEKTNKTMRLHMLSKRPYAEKATD